MALTHMILHLPVAVTHEKGEHIINIARFATVAEAEAFLNESNPLIDAADLHAGKYGIDAPEEMVNP